MHHWISDIGFASVDSLNSFIFSQYKFIIGYTVLISVKLNVKSSLILSQTNYFLIVIFERVPEDCPVSLLPFYRWDEQPPSKKFVLDLKMAQSI